MQFNSVFSLTQTNSVSDENSRLAALTSYGVMDTLREAEFDALTKLAAYICRTPIALITLIDDQRLWFKSCLGLEGEQAERKDSFCQFTIRSEGGFEVPDTLLDDLVRDNPSVVGEPFIRYYCGVPLTTPDGYRLGSLCVADYVPKMLDSAQKEALQTLAGEVMARMELNRQKARLQQQKQLAEFNEKRFKTLFDHSQGYLFTHDLSGRILGVNPAAAQALQCQPAQITGKSISFFLGTDSPGQLAIYLKKIQTQKIMSGVTRIKVSGDEERYWLYSNVLCQTGTQGPYVICSAQDVTDKEVAQRILLQVRDELKKQVESRTTELLAANAALQLTRQELEVFLYRASHDLRGPVCSLKGVVHLIGLEEGYDSLVGLIAMMNQTMLKLEHAMESLLHYTNNRQNYLSCEKLDVLAIVERAIDYGRRLKGFDRMQIGMDIRDDLPFYSDSYRVQLIIQHLLANSIAFQDLANPEPFVKVSVTVEQDWATIRLEDNGVGMPAETVPHIFGRFVKGSEQSPGSGLGLYIVKEVLKKLDGNIGVVSASGKGTGFTVRIPNRPGPEN